MLHWFTLSSIRVFASARRCGPCCGPSIYFWETKSPGRNKIVHACHRFFLRRATRRGTIYGALMIAHLPYQLVAPLVWFIRYAASVIMAERGSFVQGRVFMPLVDPHLYVLKRPRPPGTTYVLKTEVLRRAFDGTIQDLRIEVVFCDKQSYWKKDRDNLRDTGVVRVIELRYVPDAKYCLSGEWREEGLSRLLRIDIYAVPISSWKESGLNKEHVELALQQIKSQHLSIASWNFPWHCDIRLLEQEHTLSCRGEFASRIGEGKVSEWIVRA